jgi:hypothetical protein
MIRSSIFTLVVLASAAAAQPAQPQQPQQPQPPTQPSAGLSTTPTDQPAAPPPGQPPAGGEPVTAPPPGPEAPARPEAPDPEARKDEPGPEKVAVGKAGQGFFLPGILAQGWFQLERGNDATTSTFRLRRAEISVKGEILPRHVGYALMIDPAKVREPGTVTVAGPPDAMGNPTTVTVRQPVSAISALQDFYITFLSEWIDVSVGQFKIPVSWEGYNSSAKIIMPERAPVSVLFGDKRDLGLRLAKTFPKWGYSAGVFNGPGLNNTDTNNQKDAALRLEAYPIKGLTIAGVTYDSIGYRHRAGTKDRWEGDVRYEAGPYLVQAEYIRGRDVSKDDAAAVTGHGFYVAAGYTLEQVPLPLHGDLQPIVRVGYLDPDTAQDLPETAGSDEQVHYDVGLNYYLRAHEAKLQASYQHQHFDDKPANNQLIVAAQVNY